jgi:hypothetical protein
MIGVICERATASLYLTPDRQCSVVPGEQQNRSSGAAPEQQTADALAMMISKFSEKTGGE